MAGRSLLPEHGHRHTNLSLSETRCAELHLKMWTVQRSARRNGRTLGHESVDVIAALGSAVTGFTEGQRVTVNVATPCFECS
ncbi:alcohol dehydrogenase catalytic domain-containing protein [Gordonia tangerina]|nr:alcohol dehydrogenase catalytic domain-containing protein [Gordonia tangerina]